MILRFWNVFLVRSYDWRCQPPISATFFQWSAKTRSLECCWIVFFVLINKIFDFQSNSIWALAVKVISFIKMWPTFSSLFLYICHKSCRTIARQIPFMRLSWLAWKSNWAKGRPKYTNWFSLNDNLGCLLLLSSSLLSTIPKQLEFASSLARLASSAKPTNLSLSAVLWKSVVSASLRN